MEYQVPQFIEVEDKIVGPLTLKQFIYLAGGGGLCVVFFFYLPLVLAALLAIPVVALAAALTFYKVNGKPFIDVLESAVSYYVGAKLFLWKHAEPTKKSMAANAAADAVAAASAAQAVDTVKLTRGKLRDLAWSLDVERQSPDSAQTPS